MKRNLNILARLSLTGAVVCGIGFAFVALNPPDEAGNVVGVQESSADIFGMSFAAPTSTQKLQSALDRLGHEKPRVYDLNGNTVMFSTNQMRGSIDDVLRNYMRIFAEEDVNPTIVPVDMDKSSPEYKKILEAGISGGILPWVVKDDYMALGGAVIDIPKEGDSDFAETVANSNKEFAERLDNLEQGYFSCGGDRASYKRALASPRTSAKLVTQTKAKDVMTKLCSGGASDSVCDGVVYQQRQNERQYDALIQVIQEQDLKECGPVRDGITAFAGMRYDDYSERIKAFRSIEAWHNKTTGVTKVTATWSDENFDMKKTQPSRYGGTIQTEAAQKVPLCPGCSRTWAFQGTGAERPYTSNLIYSPDDPNRTARYYVEEMGRQGWEIPESEVAVQEMRRVNGAQAGESRWVRFRRGNEHLAMNFERDSDGRTVVNTATAP